MNARANLEAQGFLSMSEVQLAFCSKTVRFTPAVAALLILLGLALNSVFILFIVTIMALLGAVFPKGMPLDLLFNHVIRHWFNLPVQPPTPAPRRFSYLISMSLLLAAAVALNAGFIALPWLLAGAVIVGAFTLATTLWCLGSWLYAKFQSFTASVLR